MVEKGPEEHFLWAHHNWRVILKAPTNGATNSNVATSTTTFDDIIIRGFFLICCITFLSKFHLAHAQEQEQQDTTLATLPEDKKQDDIEKAVDVPVVEPLDVWVTSSKTPQKPALKKQKVEKDDSTTEEKGTFDFSGYARGENEGGDPVDLDVVRQAPKPQITSLSKAQIGRIRRAQVLQKQRVLRLRLEQAKNYWKDPREEGEVRLCSVNLNNYGLPIEMGRLLPKTALLRRPALERSILRGIKKARCDVVAIQGVVGRDFSSARQGLEMLSTKLQKQTQLPWKIYTAGSGYRLAQHGFLVNENSVQVLAIISHTDKLLPRFGPFEEEKFVRAPLELQMKVSGKGKAEHRSLSLITFVFQKTLNVKPRDPEVMRMQMAEALRQLVNLNDQIIDPFKPPIVIFLGDRMTPNFSPTNQVLEGRLLLTDFGPEGHCKIDQKEKIICNPNPQYPKTLFGLFANDMRTLAKTAPGVRDSNSNSGNPQVNKFTPGNKKASAANRIDAALLNDLTADIFLLQSDLSYAWATQRIPGHYQIGFEKIANGLKESPLIWVELNW